MQNHKIGLACRHVVEKYLQTYIQLTPLHSSNHILYISYGQQSYHVCMSNCLDCVINCGKYIIRCTNVQLCTENLVHCKAQQKHNLNVTCDSINGQNNDLLLKRLGVYLLTEISDSALKRGRR